MAEDSDVFIALNISLLSMQYTSEHGHLMKITQNWDALRQSTTAEHTLADATKNFWLSCANSKLSVSHPVQNLHLILMQGFAILQLC